MGHNDNDIDYIGILQLMSIMKNTMKEEFIIVKHDIQHLKFISENMFQVESKSSREEKIKSKLRDNSRKLEHLVQSLQENLEKVSESYFNFSINYLFEELSREELYKKTNKFNNLRISYMKALDIISNELDFFHKTISEYLYSLPPMIDPIRKYKRRIDRDELVVLMRILSSYRERFNNLLNNNLQNSTKNTDNNPLPLLFVDYSSSTKLSDPEIDQRIKEIINIRDDNNNKDNTTLQGFIKLPYWSIKITEYTSAIAHEIVHLYLHKKNNKINNNILKEIKEDLYNALAKTILHHGHGYNLPSTWDNVLDTFTEEVLVDLIAFIVAGPAYYFTLFMQGTARYPGHYNIVKKSTLMYARIIILSKVFRGYLKKSNLELSKDFLRLVTYSEKRMLNLKDVDKEKLNDTALSKGFKKLALDNLNIDTVGNLTPEILKRIESNNVFVLNRALNATEDYIKYILNEHKRIAYGSKKGCHYKEKNFTILQKDTIEKSIANKISSLIYSYIFENKTKASHKNIENLLSKFVKNKKLKKLIKESLYRESKRSRYWNPLRNYNLSLWKWKCIKNENKYNQLNCLSLNNNLKEIFYNLREDREKILLQDNVILMDGGEKYDSGNDIITYLIPEYLWENTLINFNFHFFDKLREVTNHPSGSDKNKINSPLVNGILQLNIRLPKLQIARVLGIQDRYDLFFGNNGSNDLQITEIREWLFTKVDWRKTYSAVKYTKTTEAIDVVKEFSEEILESNNEKDLQIGFILGDYDFIIDLKDASTRRDITWPPSKYTKDKQELLTHYSYREYIVERVEKRRDRTGQDKADRTKEEEPYILQFIKFKKELKGNLYNSVVKLLNNGYEVYLSNSWNIIFLKKNIKDLIPSNNGGELTKNLFMPPSEENIADIQSYIVFPIEKNKDSNKESKAKQIKEKDKNSSETFGTEQIKVPNMKSIIKTSGYAENNSSYEKTLIKDIIEKVIKKVNIIGRNAGKDDVFLTLGIIDYMVDWGKVSLYDAKRIAINLINKLATTEKFEHVSTLTSISVLDSINWNKIGRG